MKAISLIAETREIIGKKLKKVRGRGFLPATVYGKDIKSVSLAIPIKEFIKVYKQAGETILVDIQYDKTTLHTLITDVQIHPLTRIPLHVQFHAVNLKEKIKTQVPLEIVGESPAVLNNAGLLLHTLKELEVESLPTDLPEKIVIDVSTLIEIGQQIIVGELKVPPGVEVITPGDEVVVKLASAISQEAKKEAEEKAVEEAAKAPELPEAPPTEQKST